MPLDATNFYPKGPVKSIDLKQFFDLFTGVMVDQPVVFSNVVTIGGNQGNTSVPLKIYGALGQNTNLIDLYTDKTNPQPSFGFAASGLMAWGPGGTAPQDTYLSRIGTQNGHATDTSGLLINPTVEIIGDLKVGGDITITGGELIGTITVPQTFTATQMNLESSGAFIKAYDTDKTYVHLPKLTVTPGTTSLAGLTVNGDITVTTQVNTPIVVFPGGANLRATGGSGDRVRVINHLDIDYDLALGRDITIGRNLSTAGVSYSARDVIGGWDPGQVLNVNGNGFATGYFYNRSGGARTWDTADFTFGVGIASNTLVQRDGSGQIQAAKVYMPSAAVGGSPAYVIGQSGDGWMNWYPTSAIGPPLASAALDFVGSVPSASNPSGATTTLGFATTENDLGASNSGSSVTVPKAGQYAVALTCDWANGGGNTNDTVDLRLKANGGDIVVDSHVASPTGQPGRWAVIWKGFLAAGTVLSATIKNSFDNGTLGGGSSTLLVSFVPTAANP